MFDTDLDNINFSFNGDESKTYRQICDVNGFDKTIQSLKGDGKLVETAQDQQYIPAQIKLADGHTNMGVSNHLLTLGRSIVFAFAL